MWKVFFGVGRFLNENVLSMDRTQCIWLSIAVVILGFVCMRGFGSRSNY
ncbi:MAG TPA: hypothetical protein VL096_15530 [Pirellulaceae bacterium]|nr:hypothetical protein [Pirellulaceae bacterium]